MSSNSIDISEQAGVRYLLGEEIRTVYAVGGCLIDPEIGKAGDIDTAMITLTSKSGRFVQMNNCRRAPFGYDQRLEALCGKEVLYVENRLKNSVMIGSADGFSCPLPASMSNVPPHTFVT